jgi:hypothetical protein
MSEAIANRKAAADRRTEDMFQTVSEAEKLQLRIIRNIGGWPEIVKLVANHLQVEGRRLLRAASRCNAAERYWKT